VLDAAITLTKNTKPKYGLGSKYPAKENTSSMAVPAPAIGINPSNMP
jgi:hypothetical protein